MSIDLLEGSLQAEHYSDSQAGGKQNFVIYDMFVFVFSRSQLWKMINFLIICTAFLLQSQLPFPVHWNCILYNVAAAAVVWDP